MAGAVLLVSLLLMSCLAASCHGATLSSLQKTLIVTASPKNGQDLKAGEDSITVTWSFNTSFPARADSVYKTVQVKLCYAPISQLDRAWTVRRDVPTGTYFVRAYAYNSADEEVAYGQTTDTHKTTNLFQVVAISGRHVSLDIASICFSAFAVVSLFGFFFLEKRKTKNSQKK